MDQDKQLKVMIWNAQSIHKKRHEFFYFLRENSIDISLVSETHLNSDLKCFHPDYLTYRLDRICDHSAGGVAIFIKRGIKHKLLQCPRTQVIEALGLEVCSNNKKFNIFSIYFPGSTNANEIRKFKHDIEILASGSSFLVGGDFNAKHFTWNCAKNNSAGIALKQLLDNNDFFIHYPDTPTHFPHNGNRPSTIDLMISRGLSTPSDLITDDSFTSDHVPVLCTLKLDVKRSIDPKCYYKDYNGTNWDDFRHFIDSSISTSSFDLENANADVTTGEIDLATSSLVDLIVQADEKFVPLKVKKSSSLVFTDDIISLIRQRRALLRRLKRTGDNSLKPMISQFTKEIDFKTNRLVNKNFSKAVCDIDRNPGLHRRKFWKMTRRLKSRSNQAQIPVLSSGDKKIITDQEKSDALAEHFQEIHDETDNKIRRDKTSKKVKKSLTHIENSPINNRSIPAISIMKILTIITSLKMNKAPGPDNVNNRHLKQLPMSAVKLLQRIFTACLRSGYFPKNWKLSRIRCICKPGKSASKIDSYRPVSLLSCISKIFERVILDELNAFIDVHRIIPPHQFGFRSGKSCTHQLFKITRHVKSLINSRKSVGMLSLDLKAAFDSVWHDGILHKMYIHKFPTYLVKIVKSFLADRTFQVSIGNSLSAEHQISSGVPQGAVLSPTLFNLFLSDVPTWSDIMMAQFADDTAILAASHSTKAIINKLEKASKKLCRYFKNWRIRVNGQKSDALLFTRKRALRHLPRKFIQINQSEINWSTSIKYLGMLLDPKLKYDAHIDFLLAKSNKLLRALYPLINRKSKLSLRNKLLIYKSIFRPTMFYAAPVWMECSNVYKKKIQVFQNKVLKIILNKPRRTSTIDIHKSSGIDLVNIFLGKSNEKFYENCRFNPNFDVNMLMDDIYI